jgi:hypothetical protein
VVVVVGACVVVVVGACVVVVVGACVVVVVGACVVVVVGAADVVVVVGACVVVVVGACVVVVVGAADVVVVTGTLEVVVVTGTLVVVVVGALGCLLHTMVGVTTRYQDSWLGGLVPDALPTAEKLTVAPEVPPPAIELTSAANATATITPPARVRRRRIGEEL